MDLPGYPDQGTTKEPYDPAEFETAGMEPLEPIQMTLPTEKEWQNMFTLARRLRPFIEYFDSQAALEIPPAFIDQPWRFETSQVIKVWPDYRAMRDEYTEAATVLLNEYESQMGAKGPIAGLGQITWVAAIVTVVAVAAVSLGYFISESLKSDVQRLAEAKIPAERMEPAVDALERTAKDRGIELPDLLAKGLDLVKWGLIAAVGFIGLKVLKVIK